MTSIELGLFVVQPDWETIDAEVALKQAYGERERWRSVLHFDEGASCPSIRQMQTCSDVVCDE